MCDFGNTAVGVNKPSSGCTISHSVENIIGATNFTQVFVAKKLQSTTTSPGANLFGLISTHNVVSGMSNARSTETLGTFYFRMFNNVSNDDFWIDAINNTMIVRVIDSTNGIDSVYIDNVLVKRTFFTGTVTVSELASSNLYSGKMLRTIYFNYALTPADIAYCWNNGRPDLAPIREQDWLGINENILTGDNATFENTIGNWMGTSESIVARDTTIKRTGSASLKVSSSNTITDARFNFSSFYTRYKPLQRYRIKWWNYIPSGQNHSTNLLPRFIDMGGTNGFVITIIQRPEAVIYDTWQEYIYEFVGTDLFSFTIRCNSGAGAFEMYIDDVEITSLGRILDLNPSGIEINSSGVVTGWKDASDNELHATVSGSPDLV